MGHYFIVMRHVFLTGMRLKLVVKGTGFANLILIVLFSPK